MLNNFVIKEQVQKKKCIHRVLTVDLIFNGQNEYELTLILIHVPLFIPSLFQVRDIYIHNELFSVENGLLTPTFKGKRPALKEFFASQLAEMYEKLD